MNSWIIGEQFDQVEAEKRKHIGRSTEKLRKQRHQNKGKILPKHCIHRDGTFYARICPCNHIESLVCI